MQKHILIADDNADVRSFLRARVESELGFTLCEDAVDGVKTIERAEGCRPHLIVLDFSMTRMNGMQVAAANRTRKTG